MLLLADSGSTKTEWRVVKSSGKTVREFKTQGFNPYFKSPEQIKNDLQSQLGDQIPNLEQVFFYGAGCAHPQKAGELAKVLDEVFEATLPSEVHGDILGAARSLFQDQPGIASILGTGASSCVYDGHGISGTVPSLGYILGDYGSGAVLGREFVRLLLSEKLPAELTQEFYDRFSMDRVSILDRIYKYSFPNRFLASFIPFIHQHREVPAVKELILDSFIQFFQYYILPFRSKGVESKLAFTGSVAYHFRESLVEAAHQLGEAIDTIQSKPLDGLVKFHCGEVEWGVEELARKSRD